MSRVILKIQNEKSILENKLNSIEIEIFPSKANFLLCRYKNNLSRDLLESGIIVRDCSDFIGMDDTYFRVAVKTNSENKILVDTIRKLIGR